MAPLHPMWVRLPAAALPAAAILTVAVRWRPSLSAVSAGVLYVGAIGAVVATVTGLVDHIPYEESPLIEHIAPHQFLSMALTAAALGAAGWRWWGLRRQRDPVGHPAFLALMAFLLIGTVVTGAWGGDLVYEHRVGIDLPQ